MAVGSALHHSFQPPHRSVIDVAVQTCTWIDISSDENDTWSSETNLSPTSTRPFATFSTPEPVALVPSTDDHACVLLTACSVPILHFSGDSVGIQGCVSLNNVLSSLVRNPVVPQIPEKIVETVNAIPQEWISERIVDIPVAPAEEQTVVQGAPAMQKQVITQGGERVEETTQNIEVPVPHISLVTVFITPSFFFKKKMRTLKSWGRFSRKARTRIRR